MSWRGRVMAVGLWFPPGWREAERLARAWISGSRLFEWEGGLVLLFPEPRPLLAERAEALLLVAQDGGWTSLERGRPQSGELVVQWQGDILRQPLAALAEADLSGLWSCSSWDYQEGLPLIPPHRRPALTATRSDGVRQILPSVPAPAPQREELMERLQRAPAQTAQKSGNFLLGFFDLLKSFFGSPDNQKYVSKMIELFEKQQWQDALRYAIPLDKSVPLEHLEKFLGVLQPRQKLEFTPPGGVSGAVGTSLHGLDLLRALYRQALQQLLAAGRIEEAAFVQGELLDEAAGAVELLEMHGHLEAAARLATLKGLPAALQVRLWFQAGNLPKALYLARRYSVHAQAMIHLRSRDPRLAEQFRVLWAQDLVAVGRRAQALREGWEVRELLPEYRHWLEQSVQEGGQAAVEAVALCLQDEELRRDLDLTAVLVDWFGDESLTTHARRQRLLELLSDHPFDCQEPALQAWAQRCARRLMRQANSPFPLGGHKTLNYLIHLSGDPWLRADRPPSVPQPSLRLGLWRETVDQRGSTPLWDAAAVGDGRTLVALGHGGILVLSSRGKVSQSFANPAHRLVAPMEGERILAVSGQRICSYHEGQLRVWCSSELDGFAPHHDGYHWMVWLDRELYQIDLTDLKGWRALSRISLPGPVLALSHSASKMAVLLDDQLVYYDYPSLYRVTQGRWSAGATQFLTPTRLESLQSPSGIAGASLAYGGVGLSLDGSEPRVGYQDGYAVVRSQLPDGLSLMAFELTQPKLQTIINLPQATRVQVRIQGHLMLVCDDQGRLLMADLKQREWVARHFL